MITGFLVPASLRARTIRPGSAPTYVRRWPRMSASSWIPPSEMRANFRPSALATDSPSDVLPTPGGPTSVMIAYIAPRNRAGAGAADLELPPLSDARELAERARAGEWVVDLRERRATRRGAHCENRDDHG